MTISGGAGVMMADEAAAQGLEVASMPEEAQRRLKEKLSFCTPRNPVDITAQVFNAPHLVGAFLDAMLDEGDYGAVVLFFTYVASVEFMAKPSWKRSRARADVIRTGRSSCRWSAPMRRSPPTRR